jgi:RNA polymerase sigma-B factor
MTTDTMIVTERATAPVAVDRPPRIDTARGQPRRPVVTAGVVVREDQVRTGVLSARSAGTATVEELLRQRAALPPQHLGRAALRTRSIEAGLPLARSLAARYRGRGEPLDDLCQVAALALVKAVDGYDTTRQVAFTSYAVPTIVGALKRYFRDSTWRVRVPRRVKDLAIHLGPANAELTQQLGRSPTLTEFAARLGASDDDVAVAVNVWHAYHPDSLDAVSLRGGVLQAPLADAVGALDVGFEAVTDWRSLQPLLVALPVRERRILAMRFFGDLTQADIAVQVGMSQMHISRLLIRVLAQLRASLLDEEQPPRPTLERIAARRRQPGDQ